MVYCLYCTLVLHLHFLLTLTTFSWMYCQFSTLLIISKKLQCFFLLVLPCLGKKYCIQMAMYSKCLGIQTIHFLRRNLAKETWRKNEQFFNVFLMYISSTFSISLHPIFQSYSIHRHHHDFLRTHSFVVPALIEHWVLRVYNCSTLIHLCDYEHN